VHKKKRRDTRKKNLRRKNQREREKQMSMTRKKVCEYKQKKNGRNTTVKAVEIPVHTYIFALLSSFSTPLLPSTINVLDL
jgi:hypothetical protein